MFYRYDGDPDARNIAVTEGQISPGVGGSNEKDNETAPLEDEQTQYVLGSYIEAILNLKTYITIAELMILLLQPSFLRDSSTAGRLEVGCQGGSQNEQESDSSSV